MAAACPRVKMLPQCTCAVCHCQEPVPRLFENLPRTSGTGQKFKPLAGAEDEVRRPYALVDAFSDAVRAKFVQHALPERRMALWRSRAEEERAVLACLCAFARQLQRSVRLPDSVVAEPFAVPALAHHFRPNLPRLCRQFRHLIQVCAGFEHPRIHHV